MTRAHPRYATAVDVTLVTEAGEVSGRTANLSEGGLCAEISDAISLGGETIALLSLVFDDENRSEPIKLAARAVWCTPIDEQFQVGIQFTQVSASARHDLSLFLRFLANKSKKQ